MKSEKLNYKKSLLSTLMKRKPKRTTETIVVVEVEETEAVEAPEVHMVADKMTAQEQWAVVPVGKKLTLM